MTMSAKGKRDLRASREWISFHRRCGNDTIAYAQLSGLDSDGDGKITGKDALWSELKI